MIEKSAILHIPLSQYAFAESEYEMVIRLRAKKNNLDECSLLYADRVYPKTPIKFEKIPMEICAIDEEFSYYEARIKIPYERICYVFYLRQGQEWTYYYDDRFTKKMADTEINGKIVDGRSSYYQYPFILKNEVLHVPDWFKQAVVYNIFPDSFATKKQYIENAARELRLENGNISKSRLGGTINGIRENLEYIHNMGFTCIYLNPIFTAGEYHKYDLLDYYHIDPCFGTDEDFKKLVDEVHELGMKIVIDGVFNHCSWRFFAFEDVCEKGEKSRYLSWFYNVKLPIVRPEQAGQKLEYTCFAYEPKMPKLNTSNKEVQIYFADVGSYWLKKFNIDGWRLDVANEIDRNFWRTFRNAVKNVNPEAVLIGEVWENADSWLRGDAFDSTMNYEFRRILMDMVAGEKCAEEIAYEMEKMKLRYPLEIAKGQMNLLDSHDVPRFLSSCNDIRQWRIAVVLLMTMQGVPCLFYGDEQRISGVFENEYRQPMIWDNEQREQKFIKELVSFRKKYYCKLTKYQMNWELIKEGLISFYMMTEEEKILIIVNPNNKKHKFDCIISSIVMSNGYEAGQLEEYGFIVAFEK